MGTTDMLFPSYDSDFMMIPDESTRCGCLVLYTHITYPLPILSGIELLLSPNEIRRSQCDRCPYMGSDCAPDACPV